MKSLCFDIGTNKGLYIDANRQTFNKFLAIDANLNCIDYISNKFKDDTNISVLNAIVSSKEVETFYICDQIDTISTSDPEWISNSRFSNSYTWKPVNNIPTISLDECVKRYGLPDRIKIDVEGYELNVCKSLTIKVPELCFEWAEEKIKECLETIEYLSSIGFEQFHIQLEDKYDYVPTNYDTKDNVINWLKINTNMYRKNIWGMIWCK
jgi:FkbM family methyltransferase